MASEFPSPIDRLLAVMARLRDPENGCEWDLAQSFATIAPYTIEEAYELSDAIDRNDPTAICDELGDLLLQVVFHAQIAKDDGLFNFNDIANTASEKMIRRHPHVFDPANGQLHGDLNAQWEAIKAQERSEQPNAGDGALAGVALGLPALMRAQKLQRRAARVGFDWPDTEGPRAKIVEELAEVEQAADSDARHEEIGDLLFSVVNLARHVGVDAERALADANRKFERRFARMEQLADGPMPAGSLSALEALWERAKASS